LPDDLRDQELLHGCSGKDRLTHCTRGAGLVSVGVCVVGGVRVCLMT
jgi:hypothetical protein